MVEFPDREILNDDGVHRPGNQEWLSALMELSIRTSINQKIKKFRNADYKCLSLLREKNKKESYCKTKIM